MITGKRREGLLRNRYKGPIHEAKGGKVEGGGWDVGVGWVGEIGSGKMETTVLEQQ